MKKEEYSAAVFVWNKEGKLALQLRAADDDSYPLHWDFSAAGGIEPNEEHMEAARRELWEEIGIKSDVQFVKTVVYDDGETRDTLHTYTARHDGPFTPDPREVEKVEFFSVDEVGQMVRGGENFHPEFLFILEGGSLPGLP